ncbi:MAG: hypothetical protein IT548_13395 [Alphaproteobacteria bacterium]|nr:hypothetical protein [Alphaproteobacteria bacterium]
MRTIVKAGLGCALALGLWAASAEEYHDRPYPIEHAAHPLRFGVYQCFGPRAAIVPSFALLDAGTYRDGDGGTGAYTYNTADGMMQMTSGGLEGVSYWREKELSFRPLRSGGNFMPFECVLNPAMDANAPPW